MKRTLPTETAGKYELPDNILSALHLCGKYLPIDMPLEDFDTELPAEMQPPDHVLIKKEIIDKLSADAKEIINQLLSYPHLEDFYFGNRIPKKRIAEYMVYDVQNGWTMGKAWRVIKELKKAWKEMGRV